MMVPHSPIDSDASRIDSDGALGETWQVQTRNLDMPIEANHYSRLWTDDTTVVSLGL